jgi:hypothetical protein
MKTMKNISKKTSNLFKSIESISFGSIKLDKDLKIGLIVIILLLIFGLLIKNIISEIIQKVFTFFIIFTITILLTKNAVISLIVSIILYMIVQSIMNASFKIEKFKNEKDEETNKNIDEQPITQKELGDLDSATQSLEIDDISKATQGLEKLGKMLNGKIELKDEDKEETKPLNIDFRNTKYAEDKDTPLSKAQKETYELLNTVKGLEDTIKTLSPVLKEGKRIMDLYQSLNMK